MFYLLMAIAMHSTTMFVLKYSENSEGNRYATTLFNFLTGMIISFFLMKEKVLFYSTPQGFFAMGLAVINAICMTSGMVVYQVTVGRNGAPLTATFGRLGVLIPTVLSMIFFHEVPSLVQIVGLIIAILAIIYINGGGETNQIESLSLLLAVFVISGLMDFCSKLYGVYGDAAIQDYYVFYSFLFNTLLSLGILLAKNRTVKKKDVTNGILLGIPNQLITYSMVRVVLYLPAYLAFPLASAGVILAVNIVNFVVFREKLSPRELRATLLIGIALILLNI